MPLLALVLDDLAGAAGALDRRAGARRELVRRHGERLRQLAAAEDLDRHVARLGQTRGLQLGQADRRAVVEARVEVVEVHVLRVRPEHLERHRHLLVRAAQLAHPHVERILAALEAGPVLGAGARVVALVAPPRRLAVAGAVAAADALAVALGAGRRLQRVQADVLGGQLLVHGVLLTHSASLRLSSVRASPEARSSTTTRWRTAWTMPRSDSESCFSTDLPMPRRPIDRSVSRCRPLEPLADLTWVMTSVLMRWWPPRRAPPRARRPEP